MKQYEYDVIPSSRHLTGEFLSMKGEQGWELVSHTYMPDIVVAHIYTFKREKVEEETIEDLLERYNNPETQKKLIELRDKEERKFKLDDSFKKRMEEVVVEDVPAVSWMDEYRKEYDAALTSGMFFEWFPTFTGVWDKDKYAFCHDRRYNEILTRKNK